LAAVFFVVFLAVDFFLATPPFVASTLRRSTSSRSVTLVGSGASSAGVTDLFCRFS
jgi:hypothetical protein